MISRIFSPSNATTNHLAFMENLAKKLNITDQDGWYNVTALVVQQNGGHDILNMYNGSLGNLLSTIYPTYPVHIVHDIHLFIHKWDQTKFGSRVSSGHWRDPANHQAFMNQIAKHLNITHQEQWYAVTTKQLQQHGGSGLLTKYGGSRVKLFAALFPQYKWDTSRFKLPQGHWNSVANQRSFLDHIATKLNITSLEGWFQVTTTKVQHLGGAMLLKKYRGSLPRLLSTVYPEYLTACREAVLRAARDADVDDVTKLPARCEFSVTNPHQWQ